MNATLFVKFKDESTSEKQGFNPGYSYPVYDVVKESEATLFLLANNQGDLIWVDRGDVNRASPPSRGPRERNDRRERRPQRRHAGGRSDEDAPLGNRASIEPGPWQGLESDSD